MALLSLMLHQNVKNQDIQGNGVGTKGESCYLPGQLFSKITARKSDTHDFVIINNYECKGPI